MVFSSLLFILFFLPLTCLLYYLPFGIKYKNAILLVMSIVFYTLGEPRFIWLILGSSVANYLAGMGIASGKHPKVFLAVILILDLSVLALLKYTGIVHSMPVGLSFYTFQMISYIVDVYKDPTIVQKNPFLLILYIIFFPQLIAGPIVKYHAIQKQLLERTHSVELWVNGCRRFILGLAKKVIIANTTGYMVDYAFSITTHVTAFTSWTVAILYCLQIYYDFSGYSDMAIGLGEMFGIHIEENFCAPYRSTSIKEFWRRWHISLGTWFRDYLYIPLGGNRKGKMRTYLNKYIVFFATGLWHGGNLTFILWGLIHGTCAVFEETNAGKVLHKNKVVAWICTALVVSITFLVFRSPDIGTAGKWIMGLFQWKTNSENVKYFTVFTPYRILICLIGLLMSWHERKTDISEKQGIWKEGISLAASVFLLLFCIMTLGTESYNPFIYYRF